MTNFYENPELMQAVRNAWNDGYQSAVSNALDAEYLDQDQADELEEELTKEVLCKTCPPDTYGWHAEDEARITFGSLKRSQNEAFRQGIAWAVAWLAREEQTEFAEFLEADAKDLEGPYNEGCEVACQ